MLTDEQKKQAHFMISKPDHSDFLIHWTGRDIDEKFDPEWLEDFLRGESTVLNKEIVAPYLERLKSLLEYGLWLTKDNDYFQVKNSKAEQIGRPAFSRACFTELKLSEALLHARNYGRLGIGFKRPFLFQNAGSPVFYYRADQENMAFADISNSNIDSRMWTYFLKSMDEKPKAKGYMKYEQYEESEWRIIYSEEIKKYRNSNVFIGPERFSEEFKGYIAQKKISAPDYLLPFKGNPWFSIIIYPTLAVKVAAEANNGIRDLIRKGKAKNFDINTLTTSASYEPHSDPFEINLTACRNF